MSVQSKAERSPHRSSHCDGARVASDGRHVGLDLVGLRADRALRASGSGCSADAIGVLGAAEYDAGPPGLTAPAWTTRSSSTIKASHTADHHAGGPGGDQYTEGLVGRGYLMSKGVPESPHAETESRKPPRNRAPHGRDRARQRACTASWSSAMTRTLFRFMPFAAADGLDVLTSPDRARHGGKDAGRRAHRPRDLSYTLWQLHLL